MSHYRPTTRKKPANRSCKRYASVLATLLLLTSGCDALDVAPGNSIFLNTSRVICFEFTGLADGGSKTIISSDVLDLDDFLAGEGFSKLEILSAEVSDVTLRLRFPSQENLSVFEKASITLRAGSINTTIASSSELGTGRTLIMSASGNNIGSVTKAASFEGVLDVTGAAGIQDDFLVEVELDFSVEVEGI